MPRSGPRSWPGRSRWRRAAASPGRAAAAPATLWHRWVGGWAGVDNTLAGLGSCRELQLHTRGLPHCLAGGCCCAFRSGGIEAALPRAATLPQVGGRLGGMLDLFGCAINYNRKG